MSKKKQLTEEQLLELIEAGLSDIEGLSDDDYGWGDREEEVSNDDNSEGEESGTNNDEDISFAVDQNGEEKRGLDDVEGTFV